MAEDDSEARPSSARRALLQRLAAGGAALMSGRWALAAQSDTGPMCVVRPRHVEGPFFVDTRLNRSDIRSDPASGATRPGVPLRITFRVSQLSGGRCLPLSGAQVDLWQCDAGGLYSDVKDWQASTVGQQFLRGFQHTDRKGLATFTTIFPGWYPNRTVHIHFKVRAATGGDSAREFTSQIYFDDTLTDEIHAHPAYAKRGARTVRNNRDLLFVFRGNQLLLPLKEEKKSYTGTFDVALEL